MGSQEPLALPCVILKDSKTPSHRAIFLTQRERDHNCLISLKRRRILPFIVSDHVQTEANLEEQRWGQAYTFQPLSLFLASAEREDETGCSILKHVHAPITQAKHTFPSPFEQHEEVGTCQLYPKVTLECHPPTTSQCLKAVTNCLLLTMLLRTPLSSRPCTKPSSDTESITYSTITL